MIKIVFKGSAPFVGTDYMYVEEFDTMHNLDNIAWEYALENANSYGQVYEGDEDDYDPTDSRHFLEEDINGWWEIYDSEKHDDC